VGVEFSLKGGVAGAGLFGQTFVDAALFGGPLGQHALLCCLGDQQLCNLAFGRLFTLGLLQVLREVSHLLLQRKQPLAGVVRQDEGTGLEVHVAAEASMKPKRDFTGNLQRL